MESSWFDLEDAMELLTTSRRLTCRSSRVVASCALDTINIETRNQQTRDRDIDRQFLPRQRSAFGIESKRFQGIKTKSVFEDYYDFGKQPKSTFPTSAFREHTIKLPVVKPIETDSVDFSEDFKRKYQNVQEENLKLQAVITDLTQVNKRWQKYNNDRQIYVQKLLNTIQDQQEQLNQISERFSKQNVLENIKDGSMFKQSESSTSSTSSSSMSCESDFETLQRKEQKLKEDLQVLEFQVKAYVDDWQAEHNEKEKALQDKEVAEKRVMDLLAELQSLKHSLAAREEKHQVQYVCHCCRRPCQPETHPTYNRVYRTAVHLPYTITQGNGSGKPYIFQNDVGVDGAESRQYSESVNASDLSSKTIQQDICLNICDSSIRDRWQFNQPESSNPEMQEVSYSRSSTVPLVSNPTYQISSLSKVTTPNHSETSLNDDAMSSTTNQGLKTVTSSVQIPISKSLSAPERKSNKFLITSRKSMDSIKFSSVTPPIMFINAAGSENCDSMLDGTVTQTMENINCPNCLAVFPPKMHLKFLRHFESCQMVKKTDSIKNESV